MITAIHVNKWYLITGIFYTTINVIHTFISENNKNIFTVKQNGICYEIIYCILFI